MLALSRLFREADDTMRLHLHLDFTTFFSLGISDVETMLECFKRLRSRSPGIFILSEEHDSRFKESSLNSVRFEMLDVRRSTQKTKEKLCQPIE
ncbi:hypothetical protein J6590_011766 [Homalodisca vitripennis]|nr:hypothetical protein J6590_011766 [Homalodisca vitripennis]